MNHKEFFDKHLSYHINNMDSLKNYIATQENYIKVLGEHESGAIEFRIAFERYFLFVQIIPQEDRTDYKTYKIVPDPVRYGTFISEHINELDMSIDFGGYTKLKQVRVIQQKAAIGVNTVTMDRLNPFGEDYIQMLLSL
jgi:hypothetical protein